MHFLLHHRGLSGLHPGPATALPRESVFCGKEAEDVAAGIFVERCNAFWIDSGCGERNRRSRWGLAVLFLSVSFRKAKERTQYSEQ